jgi:hypothetical protein
MERGGNSTLGLGLFAAVEPSVWDDRRSKIIQDDHLCAFSAILFLFYSSRTYFYTLFVFVARYTYSMPSLHSLAFPSFFSYLPNQCMETLFSDRSRGSDNVSRPDRSPNAHYRSSRGNASRTTLPHFLDHDYQSGTSDLVTVVIMDHVGTTIEEQMNIAH